MAFGAVEFAAVWRLSSTRIVGSAFAVSSLATAEVIADVVIAIAASVRIVDCGFESVLLTTLLPLAWFVNETVSAAAAALAGEFVREAEAFVTGTIGATANDSTEIVFPFLSTMPSGLSEAEATLWKPDTGLLEATSALLLASVLLVSFACAVVLFKSLATVVFVAKAVGSIFTPGVLSFTTRSLALMTGTPDLSTAGAVAVVSALEVVAATEASGVTAVGV